MTIELDIEEAMELIAMHGHNILESCPNCMMPLKEEMLAKLERIRELILTLPDHVTEVAFEPEERTQH